MTTIDLKDYLRWSPEWQEQLPETARRGLLPAEAVPKPGTPPGVSEGYGTAASAAKAGLAGSTALSRVILAGVDPTASPPEGSGAPGAAAPRGGAELLRWLGSESETLLRRLPPAARGYVEALRPLAESAVEPLPAAGRQESVAGLSQALSGQLAVLRRLAAVGAPLEPLLAVARGQLGALRQAGLLPGEERAYEAQVLEEIAAARGETLLTGLLRGAAAGEAPAPEARVQLAELGLSDASGLDLVPLLEGEAQVAEARRDPLALVLERYPPLKMLERMTGRGGLYRRALVTAQRAAGVPEGEIRVWDQAESEAVTAAWLSLPPETAAEPERVQGLLDFTRDHLAGLPPEFQAHAVAELVRQGLPEADAKALLAVGRELAAGRGIAAKGLARHWSKGQSIDGASGKPIIDPAAAGAPVLAQEALGSIEDLEKSVLNTQEENLEYNGDFMNEDKSLSSKEIEWVNSAKRTEGEDYTKWIDRIGLMIAQSGSDYTLAALKSLQDTILEEIFQQSGEDEDKFLMLVQGMQADAWQHATLADDESQEDHKHLNEFDQAAFRSRNGYFLGPDGKLYETKSVQHEPLSTQGIMENLDAAMAAAITHEAMKDGRIGDLAESYPEVFAEAMIRALVGGRSGGITLGMAFLGAARIKKLGKSGNEKSNQKEKIKIPGSMASFFLPPQSTRSLQKLPGGRDGFYVAFRKWWISTGSSLNASLSKGGPGRVISPSQSFIWSSLDPYRGGARTNGLSGNKMRIFSWDRGGNGAHQSEIEVYDRHHNHLGTMDAITGQWIGGPKPNRILKVSALEIEPIFSDGSGQATT